MSGIDKLWNECRGVMAMDPEYQAKMMHNVPDASVVDRMAFVVERCKGKTVLNMGAASGGLHQRIEEVAARLVGLDKDEGRGVDIVHDLDSLTPWPHVPDPPEVVVMGELLEHLGNPGYVLSELRRRHLGAEVVITVPNAHGAVGAKWLRNRIENVNIDHVSWYSWRTLTTLLTRYGFEVVEWHWYNGQPLVAEGLVFVAR